MPDNGKVQGGKDNKLHSLLLVITGNLGGLFSKLELLSAFGRSHYQTFILLPSRRDGLQCMITSTYETHTPEISDNRAAKMENQRAGGRFSATSEGYTHTHTHTHTGRHQDTPMFIYTSVHRPHSEGTSQNSNHKPNATHAFQHTLNNIFKEACVKQETVSHL